MTGHIERRGGSWRLKFDAGIGPATGKRITRRVTLRGTKKDAERKLTELLAQRDTGSLVAPSKLLLRNYLDQWLAGWCAANIAPKTRERYGEVVRNQIVPHLGELKLQDLRPAHIGKWYADLLANGRKRGGALSARTVGHAHRVLHKALACAVEDELILRNPVGVKKPPKVERTEIQILAPDQVPLLVNAFRDRALYAFVVVGLATGARRGELLGLRWDDVDLEKCTIRFWRSLEQTSAGLRIKETKTSSGRRVVGIPTAVAAELRMHRKAQQELRLRLGQGRLPDDAPVFGTWDGNLRSPRATTKEFARVVAQAKLPPVTLHALRHTHASALIGGGLDVVNVSKRLGHASPAVTLTVYSHLFKHRDGEAVALIDAAFLGSLNP